MTCPRDTKASAEDVSVGDPWHSSRMDDAHRQAARVLLDSLSAYDSDASDEMNERAISTLR